MIAKTLPLHLRGVYVQVYRGASGFPGRSHAARVANLIPKMRAWKELGVTGVALHGFTIENHDTPDGTGLSDVMPEYAGLCRDLGLRCFASYGVNSDDPRGKGERILKGALVDGVDGVGVDAEGKFEDETKFLEDQHARDMGAPLIASDRELVVIHQPWPIPQVHAGRYPWEAFSEYCTAWANQDYHDAWTKSHGARRYVDLEPVFEADWKLFREQRPAVAGPARVSTLTGYHWTDLPTHAVRAVLRYETTWVWCEPFPTATMLHAFAARQRIERLGCAREASTGAWLGYPDWSADKKDPAYGAQECVRRFQRMWNAPLTSRSPKRLLEDGVYGPKTDAALFSATDLPRLIAAAEQVEARRSLATRARARAADRGWWRAGKRPR